MSTEATPMLEVRGISKAFGLLQANSDISLSVMPSEIHALLGENGAGKSTLVQILAGLLHPDRGQIFVDGQEVTIASGRDAIRLGIGVVHQHTLLVPALSVLENILLGVKGGYRQSHRAVLENMARVADSYHLRADPNTMVNHLTVSERQRVEIIKILIQGARLFVFDEPTSALTPQETQELLEVMRRLAGEGHAVIFITHKLSEALTVSHRVSVLRRGKLVTTQPNNGIDPYELSRLMVGREVASDYERPEKEPGVPLLECENLHIRGDDEMPAVRGLSLVVRAGEIVGICGVDGNGQQQLAEAIAGVRPIEAGRILLAGQSIANLTSGDLLRMGLGVIPGDRHTSGVILQMSVATNMVADRFDQAPFARHTFVNSSIVDKHAQALRDEYDIRVPSVQQQIEELSGGNQQKVVLARIFSRHPKVLVAVFPTLGLDIGATEYVHRKLLEQRAAGTAILLISTELDEIFALSDRIAVMYEGKIQNILPSREARIEDIGALMSGIQSRHTPTVTSQGAFRA